MVRNLKKKKKRRSKHTTPGIRWWSPTQLLVWRSLAYLWESGRDPELSRAFGPTLQGVLEGIIMYDMLWSVI